MPSIFGILMSVMMTSYSAPSILFFAVCPACTVSTRCPSRRREMSSISQMERSSSQTRILATQASSGSGRSRRRLRRDQFPGLVCHDGSVVIRRDGPLGIEAAQPQHKCGALPRIGSRPNLAFMRLHNLVDDRQPKPGAAFEVGLEGLEDLLDLLRRHARSGVDERNLPVVAQRLDRSRQPSTIFHGADRILTKIPEHLFELV